MLKLVGPFEARKLVNHRNNAEAEAVAVTKPCLAKLSSDPNQQGLIEGFVRRIVFFSMEKNTIESVSLFQTAAWK
ncbi:hypothetical protein AKJ16_DCAP11751 [Drosera capensis]